MTRKIVHKPGQIVGLFEIVASAGSTPRGDSMWKLRCTNCGAEIVRRGTSIRTALKNGGRWINCECGGAARQDISRSFAEAAQKDVMVQQREAERQARLRKDNRLLYFIWGTMKERCYNASNKKFKYYGARGIFVCDEWRDDFEVFCTWSLKHGYCRWLTIDRIDNDREYSPDNCRWTTYAVQNSNQRRGKRGPYKPRKHARVLPGD